MAGRGIVTKEYVVINESYLLHWYSILSRSMKKINIGEERGLASLMEAYCDGINKVKFNIACRRV